MLQITLLPAREGDCILLSYGTSRADRHVLIDGGRASTWKDLKKHLKGIEQDKLAIELFVVTHVDRDHIEGALKFVQDPDFKVEVKDVWFNGYKHLIETENEAFGVAQGEKFSDAIQGRKWCWNKAFGGGPARLDSRDMPQIVHLDGGLKLTLLSPTKAALASLERDWRRWLLNAGIDRSQRAARETEDPGPFEVFGALDVEQLAKTPESLDDGIPNGSSIAFLAEFEGRSILCAVDAHPDILTQSIRKIVGPEGRLKVDIFKIPHHGSQRNITTELLNLIDCKQFVISTNGAIHNHPDDVAIARIIKAVSEHKILIFNYDQPRTTVWNAKSLKQKYNYECCFPSAEDDGTISIQVEP